MRQIAFLILVAACAGTPPPVPADLRAPVLLSAAGDDSVIAESLATVRPVPVSLGKPHYPIDLQTRGIDGIVRIEFVIRSNGIPDSSSVRVVSTSDTRFNESAVAAILGTRFQPALLSGRRVAVATTQKVKFTTDR